MSTASTLPALGQRSDRLKFNFCLYRPGRLQAVMVKNPTIVQELIENGAIGFKVKPIPRSEDDRPEYQSLILKGFKALAVCYTIEGYDQSPTHSSNICLAPDGPFRVYSRETGAVEFEGAYKFDTERRLHLVGGKPLPPSCKRCQYLIGVADGVDGFIRLKVSATLRRAIEVAVINLYKAGGQQPPKYVALRDLCAEGHFWQFSQRLKSGKPEFVATTIDGKRYTGQGDAYMMPVLEAAFILPLQEEERAQAMRLRQTIAEAFSAQGAQSNVHDTTIGDADIFEQAQTVPASEPAPAQQNRDQLPPLQEAAVNDLPF